MTKMARGWFGFGFVCAGSCHVTEATTELKRLVTTHGLHESYMLSKIMFTKNDKKHTVFMV